VGRNVADCGERAPRSRWALAHAERHEGYGFVVYGPGGAGKQGDIPLCGNGRGVYQVAGEFLIETDLFACDLPYSDNAYVSALTDMETCAKRAVERIR